MAKKIVHPIAGIERQFSFQEQPPFTTADAVNVRSLSPGTGRARGGSRPGLVAAYSEVMGSDPISGTISGTPTYDDVALESTIETEEPSFAPWMVGHTLTCTVSTASYTITAYTDSSTIVVSGDASGETDAAFTIPFGQPVNCLASVQPNFGTTAATIRDDFEGRADNTSLTTSPWSSQLVSGFSAYRLYAIERSGKKYAAAIYDTANSSFKGSCTIPAISNLDTTKPYTISILLQSGSISTVTSGNLVHYIFLRMDDTTPALANCIYVVATRSMTTPLSWTVLAQKVVSGTVTTLGTQVRTLSTYAPVLLSATVTANSMDVVFDQQTVMAGLSLPAATGTRTGFGIHHVETDLAKKPLVDEFRMAYSRTSQTLDLSQAMLFASAGGSPYRRTDAGVLESISGDLDLSSVNLVDAVEMGGLLYIADHDTAKYSEESCTIDTDGTGGSTGAGRVLDKAGVDWSDVDPDNDLCYVKDSGTGGPPVGCYEIASVEGSGNYITLASSMESVDASGVEVMIARAPKIYNPVTNAISVWNQTINSEVPVGSMPIGCTLIALFQGRIFLGGSDDNPHVWQCSRVLDPLDWNYAAVDTARAVIGTSDQYGQIAQPLTAFISYLDDYMIFSCRNEMWVLRGNPADGSPITNMSQGVGVIGKRAWCHTPTGHLVFMGDDGLYVIAPNAGSKPEPLSRMRLPRDLNGIDTSLYHVSMGWEPQSHGVHIFVTPKTSSKAILSSSDHWFYDWDKQAFWKDAYWSAHEPHSVFGYYMPSLGRNVMLVGQRNGQIGRFSLSAGADHGASLDASVLVGPLRIGNDESGFGILHDITGLLATTSGDVDYAVYVGDTPEEAYDNYLAGTSSLTGTFTAGRNTIKYPKLRGVAMYVALSSDGTQPWEWDSILATYRPGGQYK